MKEEQQLKSFKNTKENLDKWVIGEIYQIEYTIAYTTAPTSTLNIICRLESIEHGINYQVFKLKIISKCVKTLDGGYLWKDVTIGQIISWSNKDDGEIITRLS